MFNTFRHLLLDVIIFLAAVGTVFFLYQTYGSFVMDRFFGEQQVGMFVRDVGVTVSVADTPEERNLGLSGVESLPTNEGKLFVFDKEGDYGFWMKDMNIPLDIIWINNERRVVHIEENVLSESYPAIYSSPEPARFVLEVNAFFASTFKLNEGDTVTIPIGHLPPDLR
ncbi:hypothetical protein A2392_00245 [Candidatus Kaiserbacteria bacterium RIFOXYB1_FULL_46_14]|uniref:DUF192 domain-containing protein n=1 Tax=Candidatus Kaiserbacteria bacterium RIFOXYB1_FULL_46_14 TaxID=1798531 RepID=A0A1F6FJ06_9BACT|nr:MAG: hypothetical protein A2392_00245 [Candidatus Kaiserbacteria bacterium RIFOXYB1_FULL_46_14]